MKMLVGILINLFKKACAADGNENIKAGDISSKNSFSCRARVKAIDPAGTTIFGENIASINLKSKGVLL